MDRVINSFFEDFVQISGDYKDDVLVILDSDREKSFTYGEIYNYIAWTGLFLSNKGLNNLSHEVDGSYRHQSSSGF